MTTQPVNRPEPTGLTAQKHRKHPLFRRHRAEDGPAAWNLQLVSAGTGVPLKQVAESPTLMLAAVEDLCWQLASSDLQGRKPHRWHRRDRAAWLQEQALLDAKRTRIAEMTAEAVSEL